MAKSNSEKILPIGVFDSGIGGLTVANALTRHLPHEEIIYFGDTAHMPYGEKSADAIRYYCLKIVKFLLEKNCKIIVIACNSATATAFDAMLDFFGSQVPFINVIDPLVEEIGRLDFQKVGIIGTKATISSGSYERKLQALAPQLNISSLATPLLAPMIEEGFFDNNISHTVIDNYLSHSSLENIDALLLACTHYPLIRTEIENYYCGAVKIFDSTDLIAKAARQLLVEKNLLNPISQTLPKHQFFVSDYTPSFEQTTQYFYKNKNIRLEYLPIW